MPGKHLMLSDTRYPGLGSASTGPVERDPVERDPGRRDSCEQPTTAIHILSTLQLHPIRITGLRATNRSCPCGHTEALPGLQLSWPSLSHGAWLSQEEKIKRQSLLVLVDPCAQPPAIVHFRDIAELEFRRHVSFWIWIEIVSESASPLGQRYHISSEFHVVGIPDIDPVLAYKIWLRGKYQDVTGEVIGEDIAVPSEEFSISIVENLQSYIFSVIQSKISGPFYEGY